MKIKEKMVENRNWLLYAFMIFMLVHAAKFAANYPCWDTPGNLVSTFNGMRITGRWFYGSAKILLSSRYDLQWIEGIIAGIFVSLSTMMMMELLQIRNWKCRLTLMVLVTAFPSMTATFVYQFCAPAYMLALFLAIFSVYLVKESMTVWSAAAAAVCLAFSLGCYQIYYIVAFSMFLYVIFLKLFRGEKLSDCKSLIYYYFFAYVGGALLYKLMDSALQKIFHYELSSYQGINGVGNITWNSIFEGIKKVYGGLRGFYFQNFNGSFYANYEGLLAILLATDITAIVLIHKKLSGGSKLLLMAIILFCLPWTYFLYLVSGGNVYYHSLMVFGNIFIYMPVFIFYEAVRKEEFYEKMRGYKIKCYISSIALVGVFLLGCYHVVNDNIIYKQMEQSAEITRFQTTEILTAIDKISEIEGEKVAIIGGFQTNARKIVAIPSTVGIADDFLIQPNLFQSYSEYYYARSFELCDDDTIENIKASEEFKIMSCYPRGEYVKKIDGVIVVKLSEQ